MEPDRPAEHVGQTCGTATRPKTDAHGAGADEPVDITDRDAGIRARRLGALPPHLDLVTLARSPCSVWYTPAIDASRNVDISCGSRFVDIPPTLLSRLPRHDTRQAVVPSSRSITRAITVSSTTCESWTACPGHSGIAS